MLHAGRVRRSLPDHDGLGIRKTSSVCHEEFESIECFVEYFVQDVAEKSEREDTSRTARWLQLVDESCSSVVEAPTPVLRSRFGNRFCDSSSMSRRAL